MNCPLCGSILARVVEPESQDRAICPICWATSPYQDALAGSACLKRGAVIAPSVKRLVDQTRFARSASGKDGRTHT
jgi:hypothetical protein